VIKQDGVNLFYKSMELAHPIVRSELQTHPNRFMSDEWRNDRMYLAQNALSPTGIER